MRLTALSQLVCHIQYTHILYPCHCQQGFYLTSCLLGLLREVKYVLAQYGVPVVIRDARQKDTEFSHLKVSAGKIAFDTCILYFHLTNHHVKWESRGKGYIHTQKWCRPLINWFVFLLKITNTI